MSVLHRKPPSLRGRAEVLDRLDRTLAELSAAHRPLTAPAAERDPQVHGN